MKQTIALVLVIICYYYPVASHLSELEEARFRSVLSFILAGIMVCWSIARWSEWVAYVEIAFLAITLWLVWAMPFHSILQAYYAPIATAGLFLELLFLLPGAIRHWADYFSVHTDPLFGHNQDAK